MQIGSIDSSVGSQQADAICDAIHTLINSENSGFERLSVMTNAKYSRSFTKKAGGSISWIVVLAGDES